MARTPMRVEGREPPLLVVRARLVKIGTLKCRARGVLLSKRHVHFPPQKLLSAKNETFGARASSG